ncbi:MAG: hypothetical protein ACRD3W_01970 [Terriglobales bacterium]
MAGKRTTTENSTGTSPTADAKKRCFIICPIGADGSEERARSDKLLKFILEPVCKKYGYDCVRADRLPNPGIITNQIMEYLVDSELVIADLTGKNPNVFYELGIRHCTGKPFIQVMFSKVEVPFDIANVRTTPYTLEVDAIEPAQKAIANQIKWISENPDKIINPVSLSVNLGTLIGGNRTEQMLAQTGKLISAMHKKVDTIEAGVLSMTGGICFTSLDDIKRAVDDVDSSVSDLDSKLDDMTNEIRNNLD